MEFSNIVMSHGPKKDKAKNIYNTIEIEQTIIDT